VGQLEKGGLARPQIGYDRAGLTRSGGSGEIVAELRGAAKGRQTQWATQFLAAAELIRRGYTVSFTQGNNTPVADLMVGSPSSKLFWVDVKGLSSKNIWIVSPKDSREELFYVLILLSPLVDEPNKRTADRFFVLTQQEANELEAAYMRSHPNDKGVLHGFTFKDAEPYENKWGKLPN
jgi:hypothetical protein